MKGLGLPLFLQLVGVAVIVAEVILPSGGLLSLMAVTIFGYSLYVVFENFGRAMTMVFVVADIIMIPILVIVSFKMLAKSPVTLTDELRREDGVSSQAPDMEKLLGCKGTAASALRPSGTALIDGHRVDVVSRGDFIEKDAKIEVVAVTGNQVIVKHVT